MIFSSYCNVKLGEGEKKMSPKVPPLKRNDEKKNWDNLFLVKKKKNFPIAILFKDVFVVIS